MDIQYGPADALVYDAATDIPGLTEFTVNRLRALVAGRRTLDLGCGTGRTTIALAEAAATICAVDNSPEMLDEFRRKELPRNIEVVLADFRELTGIAAHPFEAVYCTLGSLACCATVDELRTALDHVASAAPGAAFSYEFYDGAYYRSMVDAHGPVVPAELPSGDRITSRFDVGVDSASMDVACTLESGGSTVGSMTERVLLIDPPTLAEVLAASGHVLESTDTVGGLLIVSGTISGDKTVER